MPNANLMSVFIVHSWRLKCLLNLGIVEMINLTCIPYGEFSHSAVSLRKLY